MKPKKPLAFRSALFFYFILRIKRKGVYQTSIKYIRIIIIIYSFQILNCLHVTLFNMKEWNFFLSLETFFYWGTHAYKSSRKTSFIINAENRTYLCILCFHWNDDDCMQITRVHTHACFAILHANTNLFVFHWLTCNTNLFLRFLLNFRKTKDL